MKNRVLIIMVGLPASGKSTTANDLQAHLKKHRNMQSYAINYRRIAAQSQLTEKAAITEIMQRRVKNWLTAENVERPVLIVDAGNLTYFRRREILEFANEETTLICAVHMNRTYDFVSKHDIDAGRIPSGKEAIFRTSRLIQQPITDEGFHIVHHVDGTKRISPDKFFEKVFRFPMDI